MDERRDPETVTFEHLYTKVLTATDVSKVHSRFLIPNAVAELRFPALTKNYDSNGKLIKGEGMTLKFFEPNMDRMWEFKYCYWLKPVNDQCYVLSRNWYKFVEDYGLKIQDKIKLFKCVHISGEERNEYFIIQIVKQR